jgi:alkanesulfonate monooxygenase SsuD/methylene tetrahydromethanopterin reductase-like flavin-dependent oxidoreductase (luciferase family)
MDGSTIRLSVLDQSPIAAGSTGAEALHNTLDLARHADGLGYHRYWVAEHHGTPMLAVAREYEADEVMVVTITYDHGARRRSYELIADAFELLGTHLYRTTREVPCHHWSAAISRPRSAS